MQSSGKILSSNTHSHRHTKWKSRATCIITIINSKNSNSNSFYVLLNDCTIYWMQKLQQRVLKLEQWKKALSKLHTTECVSLEATSTSELDELFRGIQKFSRMLRHTHTQHTLSSSYQIVRFVLKISRNVQLGFAALNAKLIHSASTQCKHLASVKVAVTHKRKRHRLIEIKFVIIFYDF